MTLVNLAKTETLADRMATHILVLLAARRQSQAALARAMGVGPMWLSDRLTGKTQLTVNDLPRIAAAMGVSVVDLFPQTEHEVTVTYSSMPAAGTRPPDRRPTGHPDRAMIQPAIKVGPPGPGRTSRVPPAIAA